jgi:hypothetical protein
MSKFRNSNWIARSSFLLIMLVLIAPQALAQVTTGNLQGVVQDPNKAAVAGATVKVTNTATGISRETTTNGEGFYRVTNLTPGAEYAVEVTAQGFSPATVNNVVVRLASENSADVMLSIGEVGGGTVVVTDEQPLIQNTQSQLSQSYTPQQLTQLPFNGGSIDNLALLTPGVVTPGDTDFANGTGISANGNRGRSNNFQIDGQDNNDNSVTGPSLTLTNTEAIGEFQVITNSFSAEFGRNSGAQINTITKPGTNEFHGSLFEYHNNQALDALNNLQKVNAGGFRFLANSGFSQFAGLANRQGRDPFAINKFGGALGGPIKKNKAFFFFTYQGTYTRGEAVSNGLNSGGLTFSRESALLAAQLFPNPATALMISPGVGGGPAFAEQGTFLLAPPVVDINGDAIPDTFLYGPGNPVGNPVTASRLAPSLFVRDGAGNLRALLTGEPVRILPTDSTVNEIITREDFNLTDRDTLGVRYIFNKSDFPLAIGRAQAGALFDVPSKNHNLGVTYTRTLTPNIVNEARFNYSNLYVRFGDPNGPLPGPQIAFSQQRDILGNFTSLAFGAQNTFPQDRKVVVFQEQNTISATFGNHAIKTGIDFRQQRTENFFLPNFLGTYTFRGSSFSGTVPADTFFDENGNPRTGQVATAFENLILNRPRDINFAIGSPRRDIDQDDFFFFVQDDWRVFSTLTLNLGLRYEISTQPFNALIEQLNAREADPNTAIFDPAFPLSTRTLNKLPLDRNNFGPRVGFAWSPNFKFLGDRFTNGRTVIRGGFGVAYDPSYFNIVNNTVTAAPFVGTGTIRQNNPDLPGTFGIPFLPSTRAELNLTPGTAGGDPRLFNQTRVADDFRNPYTMSYNFGIQQELWKNSVLEARYVGSRIVGQFQSVNANPDLRFLARVGCDPVLFPNADPATCGGRFTNGVIAPGATLGNNFNNRPNTNGNGRTDPAFGPARIRINGASATYNAMQLRFDTRLANSLTLNASYTLSKTIDNASEIFGSLAGGQAIAFSQSPTDITNGERGLSAFHQKHSFTTNFIYELPWYKEQRGFSGKLLGGYQLSGFILMGSGRPYTPQNALGSYDPVFDLAFSGGFGPVRPFNGNPNAPDGTIAFSATSAALVLGDGRANPGEFILYNTLQPGSQGTVVTAAQALQQARLIYNDFATYSAVGGAIPFSDFETSTIFRNPYGDVGRNTFSGLPTYTVNMAVFKTTNLTENTKLEFRVEAANLLNRRNFGVPLNFTEFAWAPFGTGTLGAVGAFQNPGFNAGQNRSIRLGLRFLF